ncbi:hypothetical protein [Bacillus phage phiAGATE]|uniref:Uncharacterized protein n=1 Tax=Bacillus phage phiAGATE TaxID=1204533 RepID=L0LC41_9CAUD|nr:hypothetical protein G380_gp177 [Bacillus phage phiAGATE]AGB62646.1 hypothetical protein [Bacillus phage phiAGATE]
MKNNNMFHKMWKKMKYSRKIKYTEIPTTPEAKEAISDSVYRELAVLKKVVAKEMKKWHRSSPDNKYILVSIKQNQFSEKAFDCLVKHVHAMGWDVATRTFKKDYWDRSRLMQGDGNAYYSVPHFEIQIAFPGELVEKIDYVKFTQILKGDNNGG